jgi:type IV secretory pathway VirJ component
MRRVILILCLCFMLQSGWVWASEEVLHYGRFGNVTLYRESPRPLHVVLFVSGDGGWNQGVVDMAKTLSSLDAVVAGIDINHYLRELRVSPETCSYPAADFELLSKLIQKRLDFSSYVPPILVGYSSGATLVYSVLVQAPPNTFQGAISLGFCPDLPLTKPLCRGNGLEWTRWPRGQGYNFLPATHLQAPWIAFQGTIDQVCNATAVENFVRGVRRGEIVLLPKVGHGFAVQRNWMPQFKGAFKRLINTPKIDRPSAINELKGLPLIEVPPEGPSRDIMAVILSGDGGWAGIDRELGSHMASHGVPVVGFNSLQYFWTRRTPEGAAQDLERILKHYADAWNKKTTILIGYSLGADVLPFLASRLPSEALNRVKLIALLGPDPSVDFEFHITDWLGLPDKNPSLPLLPEVEKLKGKSILCFYGDDERDSLCKKLDANLAKVVILKGGHHFGGDYRTIAETILKEIE